MCVFVCLRVCTHRYMDTHTYTHTHTRTRARTQHTHTHTRSANKTYLFQQTKALLNEKSLLSFVEEKVRECLLVSFALIMVSFVGLD